MAGRDPAAAGHFTTLQVRGGCVQGRDLHVDRLRQASLRMYGTAPGPDALRSRARGALAAAGMDEGDCTLRIRIQSVGDALQVDVDIEPPRHASPQPLRVRAHPGPRALPEVKHLALDHQLEARRAAQEGAATMRCSSPPTGPSPKARSGTSRSGMARPRPGRKAPCLRA
ncbi:hypothetical protein [Luteimonas granuli]|uniref:Aminotransferase class IV n=1 Tax=Luteimonas granuli TaxID=1176533 RepID=A0A518N224_9GAMM|nr:hypothetical protein [Luteimonas granuli]QDW65958.1 hypothetical protein FPZ22_02835 [Luteimonas granuli]